MVILFFCKEDYRFEIKKMSADQPMNVSLGCQAERIFYMMFYPVLTTEILLMNGVLMVAFARCRELRTPHLVLISANAVSDILMAVSTVPFSMRLLVVNSVTVIPGWLCRLHGALHAACFMISLNLITLLSFERYQYFVHPLSYHRRFSQRNVLLLLIFALAPGVMCSALTEVITGRILYPVSLDCQLPQNAARVFIILLFFFPAFTVTSYSLVSLYHIAVKQKSRVQDLKLNKEQVSTMSTKDAIRLILLVSGVFYGSYIPVYGLLQVLLNTGITWEKMNTRTHEVLSVSVRMLCLVMTFLHGVINP